VPNASEVAMKAAMRYNDTSVSGFANNVPPELPYVEGEKSTPEEISRFTRGLV
jgi:hypothetical protein